MDHTSIPKFIALNWGLAMITLRESQANDMLSAFALAEYNRGEHASSDGHFFSPPGPIVQRLTTAVVSTSQLAESSSCKETSDGR